VKLRLRVEGFNIDMVRIATAILFTFTMMVFGQKDPDKDPAYVIIYDMCTETHPSDFEEGDIIE
jgi:hypothetical protein